MFGTSARGAAGFGFQAFTEPDPEPELTAADLPEGLTDLPPGPAVGSLNYFISATRLEITSNLRSLSVSWQSILMLIALGSILFTGYSAAVGVSNVANNFCMTLSSALVFGASLNASDAISVPQITAEAEDKALSAMSDTVGAKDVYFLDSGCSYTIVMNSLVVYYIHEISPRVIEGLTSSRTFIQAGTMLLTVPDMDGNGHTIEIKECLIDPLASVNLVAVKQLNDAGYAVLFHQKADFSGLLVPDNLWPCSDPVSLPIVQRNNVFLLTPMEADCQVQQHCNNKFAFLAASKLLHHLLEEILHHRYNHAPIKKLAHLN
eukprot:2590808-Rhodomonas_salina.1